MGRPYVKLPPGAKKHLESMAENGLLSESKAATALGMPIAQFRRVIREDDYSARVWENALAIERDALLDSLYHKAIGGDSKAAQILLAVRHGMHEKNPTGGDSERVNVTIALPPAMDAEAYMRAVSVKADPKELGHDNG